MLSLDSRWHVIRVAEREFNHHFLCRLCIIANLTQSLLLFSQWPSLYTPYNCIIIHVDKHVQSLTVLSGRLNFSIKCKVWLCFALTMTGRTSCYCVSGAIDHVHRCRVDSPCMWLLQPLARLSPHLSCYVALAYLRFLVYLVPLRIRGMIMQSCHLLTILWY